MTAPERFCQPFTVVAVDRSESDDTQTSFTIFTALLESNRERHRGNTLFPIPSQADVVMCSAGCVSVERENSSISER